MEAGIVGLPNVGKSTLFNALTESVGAEANNYPFCTIEPNLGVVEVPDPRLQIIRQHIESEKIIPTHLKIIDIAGIVRGASEGAGLGSKFLTHIREVDAIVHVVRCFEDENVTHVDGSVDPVRDIETIETELMLSDLNVVESARAKAVKTARSGDKEAQAREKLLTRCEEVLAGGRPVRGLDIEDEDEGKLLRSFGLLTAKKILYVANLPEDGVESGNAHSEAVERHAAATGGETVRVSAQIEAELAELAPADRTEMLADLGMSEPALHKVIRAAYKLLGLQSYFTAGPKEIRAWPIPLGCKAPQAAGVIHTDFERGFIRAEIYRVEDLQELGSEAAIRSAGRLRVEGKEYVMQDSDVVHFLFNV